MNVLIIGLGLIGASLAKTLKKNTSHTVLGWNRTESVSLRALEDHVIDRSGTLEELIPQADITCQFLSGRDRAFYQKTQKFV